MMKPILEIDQFLDPIRISIKQNGKISISILPGRDEVDFQNLPMPSKTFWRNVSLLIEDLHKQINVERTYKECANTELAKLIQEKLTLQDNLEQQKKFIEEKKKIIQTGSKKGMFMAGVAFGKNSCLEKNNCLQQKN